MNVTKLRKHPLAWSLLAASIFCLKAGAAPEPSNPTPDAKAMLRAAIEQMPLSFQPDLSTSGDQNRFVASGQGYSVHLAADSAIVEVATGAAEQASLRMSIAGANAHAHVVGLTELPLKTNYFIGDKGQWHAAVPNYAKVGYHDVYPGVDVSYYSDHGQLEYDFSVAPGANPDQIRLNFPDASILSVDASTGDLVIRAADGSDIRHGHPEIYQETNSGRVSVRGDYRLLENDTVAFTVASYDRKFPLIIDPKVTFTRFVEGNLDERPFAITVDNAGYSYITGLTASTSGFPNGGNVQGQFPAKDCSKGFGSPCAPSEAFIAKLDSTGNIVAYSYFGGTGYDIPAGITTDNTWVYVVGKTNSADFTSLFSPNSNNSGPLDVDNQRWARGTDNAFIAVFETDLRASKYLVWGGTGYNEANAVAVDSTHAMYVAGSTCTTDFPTSNSNGAGKAAAQAASGGGCDAFVTKIDPYGFLYTGYSTYLGGSNNDFAYGIALDTDNSAWVTGQTCSPNFPGQKANFPFTGSPTAGGQGCTAFVSKLNPTGAAIDFSVFVGGRLFSDQNGNLQYPNDTGNAIALDPSSGGVYITGTTLSPNFFTSGGVQPTPACSDFCASAFVSRITEAGCVCFSTYLGGTGEAFGESIAVNRTEGIYVSGATSTYVGFPGAPAIAPNPTAGFLTKLSANLHTVSSTTFLGEEIVGVVLTQAQANRIAIFQPTTTLYTTGQRKAPQGASFDGGQDGFVVQLTDTSSSILEPFPVIVSAASASLSSSGSSKVSASKGTLSFGSTSTFAVK